MASPVSKRLKFSFQTCFCWFGIWFFSPEEISIWFPTTPTCSCCHGLLLRGHYLGDKKTIHLENWRLCVWTNHTLFEFLRAFYLLRNTHAPSSQHALLLVFGFTNPLYLLIIWDRCGESPTYRWFTCSKWLFSIVVWNYQMLPQIKWNCILDHLGI